MDPSIVDRLQHTLAKKMTSLEDVRNDLWASLDLTPIGDEDALNLRFILETMELPAALEEFQRALEEILAREPKH